MSVLSIDPTTSAEAYVLVRQRGTIHLTADQSGLISGLRRLAAADGLAISQFRERTRGLSRNQSRTRPYVVSLTERGSDLIVTPDARPTS